MSEISGLQQVYSYQMSIDAPVEHFLRAYCATHNVDFNEAISRAFKILKFADDGRWRGERLALVRIDSEVPGVEFLEGY